ncbi:hypothetical protein ARMGADRAFT_163444 [Armillaria gallica]|uniref:Uncharacterized protein n=1 Tax=Armillaria gallica TaxID=47427 RepID=A0A2H3DTT5_ARMGA|nr:hypothetical protein ARMGADRAFT_163444 [Armillaria gallica]
MRRLFLLLLFLRQARLLRLVQLPHIPNSAIGGYDIAGNEAATSVLESTSSSPHPSLYATDTTFEGAARYQAHPPSSISHLDTLTDFTSVATPSSNVSSTNILPVAGSSGVSATISSVLLEGTAPASILKHIASLGNNVIIFTVIAFAVVVEVFWIFRKSLPESWKTGFWKYVGRIYARIIPKPVIYTTMPAFENQFKSRDLFIYGFFYGMNGLAIILPLCAIAVDHKNWQTISVSISIMDVDTAGLDGGQATEPEDYLGV